MKQNSSERRYETWEGWKRAAKAAGALYIDGDKDIAQAFKSRSLLSNGYYVGDNAIAEWDGAVGYVTVKDIIRGNPTPRRRRAARTMTTEIAYHTWEEWKRAAKNAGALYIDGDKYTAKALHATSNRGIINTIGEWDGAKGYVEVTEFIGGNPHDPYEPPIRKLELQQDGTGQWMYRLLQGERVHVDWQYGNFNRAETVKQAQGRFGRDYIETRVQRNPTPQELELEQIRHFNISAIAYIILRNWKNVNYAAKPYLDAMFELTTINDNYYNDSGRSIILYFLNNASSWKGETAKAVKAELKRRLAVRRNPHKPKKGHYASVIAGVQKSARADSKRRSSAISRRRQMGVKYRW